MSFGSTGVLAIRNWIYLKLVFTHPCRFISWKLKSLELQVNNGPIQPTENLSFSWAACISIFRGRQNCCETPEGQGIKQKELKTLTCHLPARWQALLSNSGWWLLRLLSTIVRVVGSSNTLKLDYHRELWLLLTLQRSIFEVWAFSYGQKFELLLAFYHRDSTQLFWIGAAWQVFLCFSPFVPMQKKT